MMVQQCQLWMGSLQPYMDESFIQSSFGIMGESIIGVKIMKNKFSGDGAGYCFVSFVTDEAAINAMHKLNGKPIPGTNPVIRFKLNAAKSSQYAPNGEEFSIFVGDLSSDVDDYNLYRVFSEKYQSIKSAKVVLDENGFSRGYGFIKFGLEEEQQNALYEMNGFAGLGSKPLKISSASSRPRDGSYQNHQPQQQSATAIVQQAYNQYYNHQGYQQQYYWQQQQQQQAQQMYGNQAAYNPYQQQAAYSGYYRVAAPQAAAQQNPQQAEYTSGFYRYENQGEGDGN